MQKIDSGSVITGARRVVAFGILVGLAAIILLSYFVPDARVCREAAGADAGVIRLCGPTGPSDLPAITVIVLVGLMLLLPDLGEVDIAGLVTLKRAVAEQKKETEQLKTELLRLSVRQETQVNVYPRDLRAAAEDVQEKAKAARSGKSFDVLSVGGLPGRQQGIAPGQVDAGRAVAEATIIRTWESIAGKLGQFPHSRNWGRPESDELFRTQQWIGVFRKDLDAFHAARNSVVHSPDTLTLVQLQEAVRLGRELAKSLDEWTSGRTTEVAK